MALYKCIIIIIIIIKTISTKSRNKVHYYYSVSPWKYEENTVSDRLCHVIRLSVCLSVCLFWSLIFTAHSWNTSTLLVLVGWVEFNAPPDTV